MSPRESGRWMIWVDGVGGFLTLARSSWFIGGPAAERDGAICVQAALRRREAELTRSGRHYSLRRLNEAVGSGANAHKPLRRHEVFRLGNAVQFEFCCPHPLSASARLTVEPRFRFRPHADAILLLADTLLIGATSDCHIVAPHAERTNVLFCRKNEWFSKPLQTGEGSVDDRPERVEAGQRLEICGVSLTLESA